MKTIARLTLSLLAACAFSTASQAGTIIDTGSVPSTYYNGYSLDASQWLATQFTLNGNYMITGVNGWMSSPAGGTVQMSIRNVVNGMPGSSLFSTSITAASGMDQKWVGASGLQWKLDAGNYFVAFEAPQGFYGSMAYNAPQASGPMAYTNSTGWYATGGSLGLQVFGDAAASDVPEPASIALFGVALAGLALSRRKRA